MWVIPKTHVDFIFGFLLGKTLGSKQGLATLLMLPIVLALFSAIGALAFFGASWFESGAARHIDPVQWYAWPWDWPGIHVANALLTEVKSIFQGTPGLGNSTPSGPVSEMLGAMQNWYTNFIGAVIAIVVNVFVGTMPLYTVGLLVRVFALTKSRTDIAGAQE